jgi:hypothetical protein
MGGWRMPARIGVKRGSRNNARIDKREQIVDGKD